MLACARGVNTIMLACIYKFKALHGPPKHQHTCEQTETEAAEHKAGNRADKTPEDCCVLADLATGGWTPEETLGCSNRMPHVWCSGPQGMSVSGAVVPHSPAAAEPSVYIRALRAQADIKAAATG
jgi:hypothetical protein